MPWEKGQSGNPDGRKREVTHVRELARVHTEEAIRTLAEIMADPSENSKARVAACQALLDRGWGKAPADIRLEVYGNISVAALTPSQREIEIRRLIELRERSRENNVLAFPAPDGNLDRG